MDNTQQKIHGLTEVIDLIIKDWVKKEMNLQQPTDPP